jgi:hypothetical protein
VDRRSETALVIVGLLTRFLASLRLRAKISSPPTLTERLARTASAYENRIIGRDWPQWAAERPLCDQRSTSASHRRVGVIQAYQLGSGPIKFLAWSEFG